MLSFKLCRELLGDKEIDDETLKVLRQDLYALAEAVLAIHENPPKDTE